MQASLIAGLAILMGVTDQPHRQRRRGEELEAALLAAAWDELVEAGFHRLTMESVAARAKTGVAVLYRRWPRKDDLVLAAIAYYGRTHPVEIPDTGSLRGDMLALLGSVNDQRSSFTAVVTAAFTGLLASTRPQPGGRPRQAARRPADVVRTTSSGARMSAVSSTWTRFPPPCCRCRST